ncbi:UNVERIFIED_ORG: sugar fermentation stimulation protein [Clostridium botulinum]|nr:DNA/RNA nuclease SfsA [Clostridium botulinum]MBY6973043.1 DNA/RNA nuclease SfsA [Clostridium botulinum]NFG21357.1 sugar fermentation stimulation protein [Clostridium botulinum]NFO82120.1 sugar fermentation stimulation protein [Clostridium botulinum]HBJ1646480.1 DNA/RNA nuclease SfsA [Clostridium botulinum]
MFTNKTLSTERGTKHLLELIEVKNNNIGAGVLFLVQLENVKSFSPNDDTDPKFAAALKKAKSSGVDIFVYKCSVSENHIELSQSVELKL